MRIVRIYNEPDTAQIFEEIFMSREKIISFDLEADGPKFTEGNILSIQLRVNKSDNVYVVLGEDLCLKTFRRLLSIEGVELVGHNIKFDLRYLLYKLNGKLKEFQRKFERVRVFDTMLAYVLTCVGKRDCDHYISLQDLLKNLLGIEISKEIRKEFEGAKELSDEMIEYAATDVLYLYELREVLLDMIRSVGHEKVLGLEMELLPVVAWMEVYGIRVDTDRLEQLSEHHFREYNRVRQEIIDTVIPKLCERFGDKTLDYIITNVFDIKIKTKKLEKVLSSVRTDSESGREILADMINVASPKQLKGILTKGFGINIDNTNEKTIAQVLRNNHLTEEQKNILQKILDMRDHFKKFTAFGKNYRSYIDKDGRVRAEFNQLGTDTGRFSSSKPNLQQVPRDEEYRKMFVATDDSWKIISADYSQMELRMMFDVSRETKGIEAYKNRQDIHRLTASFIFNKPIEDVTSEERNIAKSVNFAVIYGTTAKGLQYNLYLSEKKAKEILQSFYTNYSNMASFIKQVSDIIVSRGYSVTPFGRKRFFAIPKVFRDRSEMFSIINRVKRQGVNHIIQGGCADVVKIAMIKIFKENPFGEDLRILLQVHDEIVCEAKLEIAEEAAKFIEDKMREAFEMFLTDVPAVVEAKIADHWKK